MHVGDTQQLTLERCKKGEERHARTWKRKDSHRMTPLRQKSSVVGSGQWQWIRLSECCVPRWECLGRLLPLLTEAGLDSKKITFHYAGPELHIMSFSHGERSKTVSTPSWRQLHKFRRNCADCVHKTASLQDELVLQVHTNLQLSDILWYQGVAFPQRETRRGNGRPTVL